MSPIRYRSTDVDGIKVFYREAQNVDAPKLLLLRGFPTAGHKLRELFPLLGGKFHLVAPDLPSFGLSDMPSREEFNYTFENIARVIERFTEIIGFDRFALYLFDYGAPTGFRMAVRHPERITAIISQNGNAYEEGLSDGWTPIRAYWQDPSEANRKALRAFLTPETTRWQYTHGVPDQTMVSPDGQNLDNYYLARLGCRRNPTRPFRRLPEQRRTLSSLPTILSDAQAAVFSGVGQQRSVLPSAGHRSVSARHSRGKGALLRHRPLRAGDALRRNREGHPRVLG